MEMLKADIVVSAAVRVPSKTCLSFECLQRFLHNVDDLNLVY